VGGGPEPPDSLRGLPAVHELAAELEAPHRLAVAAARRAIEERRRAGLAGRPVSGELAERARELLDGLRRPSLRPVINATGVIIHTNLGRAPLAAVAREAVARAADGYCNLELDLAGGGRGSRHAHVEAVLRELTGAEAALVVNNGAAAVLLAVAALAGPGRGVIVARGQLVEIGGGFRIPEVLAQCGAELIEVGTTNRTRLRDYAQALERRGSDVAAILRVHQSNFRTVGFVEDVPARSLCGLGVPVIDDVGSGVLGEPDGLPELADEPPIAGALAAGAELVCCSADKLLGGPQGGLLLGSAAAIAAAREHPLARAVRIDKLSLAGLEATLKLYLEPERARREVPVLAMLAAREPELAERARALAEAIGEAARIVRATARVGGGTLPLLELEGPAVALEGEAGADALAAALRRCEPPVIARIHDGRVLLDPRTLRAQEIPALAASARAALRATAG